MGHLACLFLAPLATPVAQGLAPLPDPSGPHPVGTRTAIFEDATRPDPLVPAGGPRTIALQLWYPAAEGAEGERAPYVDGELLAAFDAHDYHGQGLETLADWEGRGTSAIVDAPARAGPLPVVLLSHGLGVSRTQYTGIAQDLASHGYLVAVPDHPHGGFVCLPDGRVLTSDGDPLLAQPGGFGTRTSEWAEDLVFLLDQLDQFEQATGADITTETARVVALGHSMGGAAAIEAAQLDARIVAAANLDGGPSPRLERDGVRGDVLVLKGMAGLPGDRLDPGEEMSAIWRELVAHGGGRLHFAAVFGSGHMSFSDAPFVMPDTITRFGTSVARRLEIHAAICRLLREFAGLHLRGEAAPVLAGEERVAGLDVVIIGPD